MADLEDFAPVTSSTLFRLGSISKPITATAILQLWERGKLDLDAPVQKYCPAFPQREWPITARELLAHLALVPDRKFPKHRLHRDFQSLRQPRRRFIRPARKIRFVHAHQFHGCRPSIELLALRHKRHALQDAQQLRLLPRIEPQHPRTSLRRPHQPQQHPHRRRFPRAVASQESVNRSWLNLQVQFRHCCLCAKRLAQALRQYSRFAHGWPPSLSSSSSSNFIVSSRVNRSCRPSTANCRACGRSRFTFSLFSSPGSP